MRLAFLALACAALVAGCGSSNGPCSAPSQAKVKTALAGSPPDLAAIHAQANQLVGGSKAQFDARMASLRGTPVVVNKWASWCGPCRGEFPVFQQAGLAVGKKVAFLGLDGQDNDGDAKKFLACFPVTYPSYRDPDLKISNANRAAIAFPTTIFYNRAGKLVYSHPGPYSKASDLLTDIRRYAG